MSELVILYVSSDPSGRGDGLSLSFGSEEDRRLIDSIFPSKKKEEGS
jgi:hypothetical protein